MDNVKKLPLRDFTRYCMSIAQVPSSYLSGLTLEEQLLWLCSFLTNEVIPTVNNNGEAVEELQTLYIELKNYVDNYFDNLDIQEEVNTKLEEMAQSGELAELIAQYLEAQAVIGFNTCSGLAGATNLADGSFARTLGRNTYKDGYGAFYKIRTRINADVPDGYNIIELTNTENLVAERIESQTEKDVSILNNDYSLRTNKKIIFIGDSYAQGYSPDGNVTSWVDLIISQLGLTSSQYIKKVYGGTGFVNTVDNKNFITLLDEITSDNDVTDIICCGGYNDQTHSSSDITQGINNFFTVATTKFPNAKVHIGHIGWSTDGSKIYNMSQTVKSYKNGTYNNNGHYLNNVEYAMHEMRLFASDGVHPNNSGQDMIKRHVLDAFLNGTTEVYRDYANCTVKSVGSNIAGQNFSNTLGGTLNNGIVDISTQTISFVNLTNAVSFSGQGGTDIEIFELDNSYVVGNTYYTNSGHVRLILVSDQNVYYNTVGTIYFYNKKVHLQIKGFVNDNHTNYQSFNLKQIQIQSLFHASFESLMC